MSHFSVDAEELHRTSSQLSSAVDAVDVLTQSRAGLEALVESVGSPIVTDALYSFLGAWSYGLSCLKADATTIADQLGVAGRAYEVVDDAVGRAAGDMGRFV